jgi:tetratricopeptide (TPR) repeat protein
MAKTTAITLPGVFLLLYIHEKHRAINYKEIALQLVPTIPVVVLFWYLNVEANNRNFLIRHFDYSNLEHLVLASYSYSFYWVKSLFPYPLAVFYPAPSEHLPLPLTYYFMFALSCLIMCLMIYHFIKKQYTLFFALAFYTITILPMLDLMYYPLGDLPMLVSNRYYYHSSLGILLYIILILDSAIKNQYLKTGFVVAYLAMLILLFKVHQPVWKDEISVFENDVKYYPSEDFLYKLALLYEKQKDTDKALRALDKADKLGTDIWINNVWSYYYQRSKLYVKAAKYDKAIKDINTALQKKEFKTPSYDSLLTAEKKEIEVLITGDSIRKQY